MQHIAATQQTVRAQQGAAVPYPPSWVDRFDDWVRRLPIPAWLFYLGAALVFVLIRAIAAWSDGTYPFGTVFPTHIMNSISGVYWLLALHYLDARADVALADFRPVLNVDGPGYERLRYQLTTMPARPVLLWSLVGFLWGLVANSPLLWSDAQLRLLKLFTSPAAAVVDYATIGFSFMLGVTFIYHTVRQLRLVSRIYTQHTNVNIFETGPLYALSRISATTTVALLFLSYLYLAVAFNWQVDIGAPGAVIIGGSTILVAIVTFVWPLFGAHRLLQEEKARWKGEVAKRIEALARKLHHRVDIDDMHGMDELKDALDSLIAERGVLDKASTWPWEPESVRAVVTALVLPMAYWMITRVLERFGF